MKQMNDERLNEYFLVNYALYAGCNLILFLVQFLTNSQDIIHLNNRDTDSKQNKICFSFKNILNAALSSKGCYFFIIFIIYWNKTSRF